MIYVDTSAAISYFVRDAHTDTAIGLLTRPGLMLAISDLCVAEFIASISMHVRMGRYPAATGHELIEDFESWAGSFANLFQLQATDTRDAINFLRRFELKLRTPDALHLAICKRAGAHLASFDDDQSNASNMLGIPLAIAGWHSCESIWDSQEASFRIQAACWVGGQHR